MMNNTIKTHGGRRPGAGRKPGNSVAQPTTVIRVPVNTAETIKDFVSALKRKRTLQGQTGVVDLIQFAQTKQRVILPLYTSKVSAGFPSPADDHVEQRLNPSDYLVKNDTATFFVRIKGDSMIEAGIFDNDVLVIDRSRTHQTGDIVLAVLDGEFTVKILGRSRKSVKLIPANRNYPVIEIKKGQSLEIWGVVTGSMRKFK
ncbi:MAG: LexA family protein [Gammaproteobacteria bacterium]